MYPIVVDLDGTLIHTDMLHESALRILRDKPVELLKVPGWLHTGKAALKHHLARSTVFDPTSLPYNAPLLAWLRTQREQGRTLILCTASDVSIANAIAQHLDLFDEVMASNGVINLAGRHKAEALEQRFGRGGFDYAGNSHADLHVWDRSRRAIVVNASSKLAAMTARKYQVDQVFASPRDTVSVVRRALRVHQWLKNLLLFVPLLAAHQFSDFGSWGALVLALLSFSLCASTVYIANDLLDLESDRQHPRKRERPFASGGLPAWSGAVAAPILFAASMLLALGVGGNFLFWLLVYFGVTCVYSWWLKRLVLIDCLTLAVLYTLRIVAGAAAADVPLSFWLLAFSVFLFLSLAYVKRYAELQVQVLAGKLKVHGRGYLTSDASLLQMLGIASGYASAVVLALYVNSDVVSYLYRSPHFVWGTVPVMLFWISWMWLQAHRGHMHDDPLVFAVKDRTSQLVGLIFIAFLMGGILGLPL